MLWAGWGAPVHWCRGFMLENVCSQHRASSRLRGGPREQPLGAEGDAAGGHSERLGVGGCGSDIRRGVVVDAVID